MYLHTNLIFNNYNVLFWLDKEFYKFKIDTLNALHA